MTQTHPAAAPAPSNLGLKIHAVLDHGESGLRSVFEVEPGTNLFGRGAAPADPSSVQLPLLDLGREEIFGDAVLKRPSIQYSGDAKAFELQQAEQRTFLANLGTWFIWHYTLDESENQTNLSLAHLRHLQTMPKAKFEAICKVSHLEGLDTVDEKGHTILPRTSLPPAHEAWGGTIQSTQGEADLEDMVGTVAAEVAVASLAKDPAQRTVGKALMVNVPGHPGHHALLGEVLAPYLKELDTFGITLQVQGPTRVRILVLGGKFFVTRVDTPNGVSRLDLQQIGRALNAAFTAKSLSPEQVLLRKILGL